MDDWNTKENLVRRLRELAKLAERALDAANPEGEPWRCPHFKALAKAAGGVLMDYGD